MALMGARLRRLGVIGCVLALAHCSASSGSLTGGKDGGATSPDSGNADTGGGPPKKDGGMPHADSGGTPKDGGGTDTGSPPGDAGDSGSTVDAGTVGGVRGGKAGPGTMIGSCEIFPSDNPWNVEIDGPGVTVIHTYDAQLHLSTALHP